MYQFANITYFFFYFLQETNLFLEMLCLQKLTYPLSHSLTVCLPTRLFVSRSPRQHIHSPTRCWCHSQALSTVVRVVVIGAVAGRTDCVPRRGECRWVVALINSRALGTSLPPDLKPTRCAQGRVNIITVPPPTQNIALFRC